MLEAGLVVAVAGSAAAFGAVHPWVYVPLFWLALVLALLTLARARIVAALRSRLGSGVLTCSGAGRWVAVSPDHPREHGWHLDLGRRAFDAAPLLRPGLVMVGLVLLQLVPLPASLRLTLFPLHPLREGFGPLTVSAPDTCRGLAFLAAALAIHATAAAVEVRRASRVRVTTAIGVAAVFLGLVGLVQAASGASRIYGAFKPLEGGTFFGPFVNRNHFATWMAMAACVMLGMAQSRWRFYAERVGVYPNLRRRLLALQSGAGVATLYALGAATVAVASVIASGSRGGVLALVGGIVLAGVGVRTRRGVPAWVMALTLVALSVSWYGMERLQDRFEAAGTDARGRTTAWKLAWDRRHHAGVLGSGFNTFAEHVSVATAWRLPLGASSWPPGFDPLAHRGRRVPGDVAGHVWFREAHNDWLQVLVETGWPGLAVAAWAAVAALKAARHEPWRLGALAAALLHAFVDFSLQIPAVALLFVVIAVGEGRSAGVRTSSA